MTFPLQVEKNGPFAPIAILRYTFHRQKRAKIRTHGARLTACLVRDQGDCAGFSWGLALFLTLRAGGRMQAADKLLDYAADVFGSRLYALLWFDVPLSDLGITPNDLVKTPEGREVLFLLLAKIEAGKIPHHRRAAA